MLTKTIVIGKYDDAMFNDSNYFPVFLKSMEHHANAIIWVRGYMYLNQIFESLKLKWNPDGENLCIRGNGEKDEYVTFKIVEETDDGYLIHIHIK